jgi:hypothetical protein
MMYFVITDSFVGFRLQFSRGLLCFWKLSTSSVNRIHIFVTEHRTSDDWLPLDKDEQCYFFQDSIFCFTSPL